MHTKEYLQESIMHSADSAKDIAVIMGVVTDMPKEEICYDTLSKMACSFAEISQGMCHNLNALEKMGGMNSSYSHNGHADTKLDQVMQKAKMKIEHMPEASKLAIQNDFAGVMTAHVDKAKNAEMARRSAGAGKQHFEEYKQGLLELGAILMYEYYLMSCKED